MQVCVYEEQQTAIKATNFVRKIGSYRWRQGASPSQSTLELPYSQCDRNVKSLRAQCSLPTSDWTYCFIISLVMCSTVRLLLGKNISHLSYIEMQKHLRFDRTNKPSSSLSYIKNISCIDIYKITDFWKHSSAFSLSMHDYFTLKLYFVNMFSFILIFPNASLIDNALHSVMDST